MGRGEHLMATEEEMRSPTWCWTHHCEMSDCPPPPPEEQ